MVRVKRPCDSLHRLNSARLVHEHSKHPLPAITHLYANLFKMSDYDIFTDDYVAKLLAKDAKESSIRYSAIGLQAYAPSK